jgi:hypothetical protein
MRKDDVCFLNGSLLKSRRKVTSSSFSISPAMSELAEEYGGFLQRGVIFSVRSLIVYVLELADLFLFLRYVRQALKV